MMYMKQILQLYVLIGRILSNFRHNISETLSVFAPSTSVSEQRTVVVVFPTDGSSDRFNDSRIHSCTYRHNSETCSKMGELASWPGVPLPFFLCFFFIILFQFGLFCPVTALCVTLFLIRQCIWKHLVLLTLSYPIIWHLVWLIWAETYQHSQQSKSEHSHDYGSMCKQ